MNRTASQIIAIEEGYSPRVYMDTEGYPTVGYGLKIGGRDIPFDAFAQFPYMPEHVAFAWLDSIVLGTIDSLSNNQWFRQLDDVRAAVCVSMAYQLGLTGFYGFRNTIECIEDMDFLGASINMLDSRWAQQTPNRARRHAEMMEGGELDEYYKSARWANH